MIVQMHSTLLTLEDNNNANLAGNVFEELYEVDCFKEPKQIQKSSGINPNSVKR